MAELEFKFSSPKFKVLYPEYREKGKKYVAVSGGRSSSKSWSIALFLIDVAQTYDRLFIVCGREIMKSIEDSSKKLLEDTIRRLGVEDDFEIQKYTIRCRSTGSFFKFMGLSGNIDAIKGLEGCDIFWADEASSLSRESLEFLGPTIRKHGAQIIFTWNPDLPTTPVEAYLRVHSKEAVRFHINYTENAYCSPETIREAEADREADIEYYNWKWLGHFRKQSQDTFISLGHIIDACQRPMQRTSEGVVAGLDIGLYHDRNVLVIRQGPNVIHTNEWGAIEDVDAFVNEVVGYVHRYSIRRLAMDANGQGAAIYLKLRKPLGGLVYGVQPGAAARNAKKYSKLRDESWGLMRDWLPTAHLPAKREADFTVDCTNLKFFYDEKGRYKLESKKQYLGRGFHSPDYGDALAYSMLVTPEYSEEGEDAEDGFSEQEQETSHAAYDGGWMGI